MIRMLNRVGLTRSFGTFRALRQESSSVSTLGAILNKQNNESDTLVARKKAPQMKLVKFVLHGLFRKNNSHLTLTKVEYDKNFEQNNPQLSFNEKVLYYLTLPEKTVYTLNTGTIGFRGAQRGEYEAAYQLSSAFFRTIRERKYFRGDVNLEVVVKEFGKGRRAFFDALKGKEGLGVREHVCKLTDMTPIKFGGVRGPSRRRL
ncbi:hypothetical protein KL933_002632 [Ogataea haglerorum]|uniref:Small ribosomal subunit protein uS11m n=2 Tax=Ogataea haglerorum TaxID=1937702 RepID=A0AAN6I0L2_9ASCO|nr:hypothetical protein KL914_003631 [Ogataea haglerorum]KAG7718517.1 hypothetical protein KL913_002512 [Ogataea haglerorum]KAG7727698.1 hypothetical protein KL933_002632 [Ogataea haglerorum]KAG7757523.1 hypothetical protein KL947_003151 [Ogataea haglerorum]KAG7767057.1 hypothetical protein KL931_003941 [Ogataea haglerorum]